MKLNLSPIRLTAILTLLTAKRLMLRKSTWLLGLLGLLPVCQGLFWVLAATADWQFTFTPYHAFLHGVNKYFLNFYVPVLSIFLGLGVIRDEVESKNLTYTSIRPLSSVAIAAGRLAGHLLVTWTLLVLALILMFGSGMVFQPDLLFTKIPVLINAIWICIMGSAAYLSVVAALGTVMRRFAILASIFWMIIDTLFSLLPSVNLQAVSVKYRMLASALDDLPRTFLTASSIDHSSALLNALACFIFAGLALTFMAWWLSSRDIVFSEPNHG